MPITSLPSKYGIGCFSKSAYDFVDWLKGAGHNSNTDAPQEVNRLIREFVYSLS